MLNLGKTNSHAERLAAHVITWFVFFISIAVLMEASANVRNNTPESSAIGGFTLLWMLGFVIYLITGIVGFFQRSGREIEERNSAFPIMQQMPDGMITWWQLGKIHRLDGPAVIYPNGVREWCRHGIVHREDGPAIEGPGHAQKWYLRGHLHRNNGPAVTTEDGTKLWYQHNLLTRSDGPAIEFRNGTVQYWVDGLEYSAAEFESLKLVLDNG